MKSIPNVKSKFIENIQYQRRKKLLFSIFNHINRVFFKVSIHVISFCFNIFHLLQRVGIIWHLFFSSYQFSTFLLYISSMKYCVALIKIRFILIHERSICSGFPSYFFLPVENNTVLKTHTQGFQYLYFTVSQLLNLLFLQVPSQFNFFPFVFKLIFTH